LSTASSADFGTARYEQAQELIRGLERHNPGLKGKLKLVDGKLSGLRREIDGFAGQVLHVFSNLDVLKRLDGFSSRKEIAPVRFEDEHGQLRGQSGTVGAALERAAQLEAALLKRERLVPGMLWRQIADGRGYFIPQDAEAERFDRWFDLNYVAAFARAA